MTRHPALLPQPREIEWQDGRLSLTDNQFIVINSDDIQFTAMRLQTAVRTCTKLNWEIGTKTEPVDQIGAMLTLNPNADIQEEGYQLRITAVGIEAIASTHAGLFYAVCTLAQLLQVHGNSLPRCTIHDRPDFAHRGVMLDISRDRVPTMETLYGLIDLLAGWKINQFQLYTEHTFAYRNHQTVWAEASPMTGEEILALDAYCRERFIELVPNQNSFGHMHRWLDHDEYKHLAEAPDGAETPWNFFYPGPYSLSPAEPGSLELVRELFDELLPYFSSNQFNIGADETFDLGQGKSKALVEEKGVGRVYLDFLLALHREVKARHHIMQFWGDIIVHYPELVPELPRDAIALEWGYEADHPFDKNGALFAQSGIPFYLCPGTSSWNTVGGRTANTMGNLQNAVSNGLIHGAIGILITDWGDNGHWQPLPVSYLGFGYGAALSWAYEVNREVAVAEVIGRFAFQDFTLGQIMYDLGCVHELFNKHIHNTTLLFQILQNPPEKIAEWVHDGVLTAENVTAVLAEINRIKAMLPDSNSPRPDADLIGRELTWIVDMLCHACHRAQWVLAGSVMPNTDLRADAERLIEEYHAIWHARSRPGGYSDSVARLEKMWSQYGDG